MTQNNNTALATMTREEEKKQVKAIISKLPAVTLVQCTEDGKHCMDAKGQPISDTLQLSEVFKSFGAMADKYSDTVHFRINGCTVSFKKGSNAGNRVKAFVKELVPVMLQGKDGANFCTSLRAKYDFPISEITAEKVLQGIAVHEKAVSGLKSLVKLEVSKFGYNPEKIEIAKTCTKIRNEFKVSAAQGFAALNSFDRQTSVKLLS